MDGQLKSRVKHLLNSVCGVDLAGDDEDGAQALSRKLMADPGYEDAADDHDALPQARATSWLSPVLGNALGSHDDHYGAGRYAASPSSGRYAPPAPLQASAGDASGAAATWTEATGADSSTGALPVSTSNPLDDLNALMARVEELEAAGDLDAAARLLSGAVQRR
jgi:hypothetical protein